IIALQGRTTMHLLRILPLSSAFMICAGLAVAQPQATPEPATLDTESPRSSVTTGTASGAAATTEPTRFQRARRAPPAPPGEVWPTAAGKLGGATSATQDMPIHVDGLIEMRRPFTNRPEFRGAWITRF